MRENRRRIDFVRSISQKRTKELIGDRRHETRKKLKSDTLSNGAHTHMQTKKSIIQSDLAFAKNKEETEKRKYFRSETDRMTFRQNNRTKQQPHFAFIQVICVPHGNATTHIYAKDDKSTRKKKIISAANRIYWHLPDIQKQNQHFSTSVAFEKIKIPEKHKISYRWRGRRKKRRQQRAKDFMRKIHVDRNETVFTCGEAKGEPRETENKSFDHMWFELTNANRSTLATHYLRCVHLDAPHVRNAIIFYCAIYIYFKFQ